MNNDRRVKMVEKTGGGEEGGRRERGEERKGGR